MNPDILNEDKTIENAKEAQARAEQAKQDSCISPLLLCGFTIIAIDDVEVKPKEE